MNTSKAYELEHGTDIRPGHEGKSMKEILQEAYTEKFERTKYIFVLDARRGGAKSPPSRATFRRSDVPSQRGAEVPRHRDSGAEAKDFQS